MTMAKGEEEKKRQSQQVFFFASTDKPPNAMKKSATWRECNTRGTRKQIKNCAGVLTRKADHPKVLVASRRALAMSTPIPIP